MMLLVAMAATSGCGGGRSGGGRTSANSGIEAICARHNHAIAALAGHAVESEGGLRSVQRQRAVIEQAALGELQRLTPGAPLRSIWPSFLADRRTLIGAVLAYSQHPLDSRSVEEANVAAHAQAKMLAAAGRVHLKECARAG